MRNKPSYDELRKRVGKLEQTSFELKNAKKALSEGKRRYRLLYEKTPVMVHSIDPNGKLLMVSDYWLAVLGYERNEVIGRKSTEFFTNESQNMALNIFLPDFFKTGFVKDIPYQMVKKNGEIIDVLLSAISEKDDRGKIIQSFAVLVDITERRILERTTKIYENIVSSTPDGIAFLDQNYRYKIVNGAYERFSGKKQGQFVGMSIAEYLGEDIFNKRIKPNFDKCLNGEIVRFQEKFNYSKLGERNVEVTYFPYKNSNNRITGVVANTRDITEQTRAQEKLEQSYREIETRAKIAKLFLTLNRDQLFENLLSLLLDNFYCRYAHIGYVDENEKLVFFAIYEDNQEKKQLTEKSILFPIIFKDCLWNELIKNQRSIRCNKRLGKHKEQLLLTNYLIVPLMANNHLYGQIVIANKLKNISIDDQKRLEFLAKFIASVLRIYLDKEKAQRDLQSLVEKLREKNIALKVLLENREEEKRDLTDSILINFEKRVFPYFERLKSSHSKDDMLTIQGIIESNTNECLSLLRKSISITYQKLTPMEIQVADLVKAGKTSKQIALMFNMSPRSVYFHRNNIRKKLKIHKTKTNLRSFLNSL